MSPRPNTTTGSPDDATRVLEHGLFKRDLHTITAQLEAGASLDLECMAHELRNGEWITDLTALSWAVALDSDADGLFLTPLLLHCGGNIAQVDSKGRTLLEFACSASIARYLIEHGAPLDGGDGARQAALALLGSKGPMTLAESDVVLASLPSAARAAVTRLLARAASVGGPTQLLPRSTWRKALDADHLAVLKHFGYGELVDGGGGDEVTRGRPPLLAAFHPAEVIGWALRARDTQRVRFLIRRGGANGDHRFSRLLEIDDITCEFRGLTATGLAFLIDCENERLSAGRSIWMRGPAVSPVFTTLLMGKRSLHGVHDADGNTLVHMAVTPGMCSWLLGQGLPVDVKNSAGQLPDDVVPDYVRLVIEKHRLSMLPAARNTRRKKPLRM